MGESLSYGSAAKTKAYINALIILFQHLMICRYRKEKDTEEAEYAAISCQLDSLKELVKLGWHWNVRDCFINAVGSDLYLLKKKDSPYHTCGELSEHVVFHLEVLRWMLPQIHGWDDGASEMSR
jgi:hypothetical protein